MKRLSKKTKKLLVIGAAAVGAFLFTKKSQAAQGGGGASPAAPTPVPSGIQTYPGFATGRSGPRATYGTGQRVNAIWYFSAHATDTATVSGVVTGGPYDDGVSNYYSVAIDTVQMGSATADAVPPDIDVGQTATIPVFSLAAA